jgi:hypothetical protein
MSTGRLRLQLRRALLSVCALAAFAPAALPQEVSKAIKDEIKEACQKPGSQCQATIIDAALGFRGSNARARLSLLKAKDPGKRVGALLSVSGFSEQVNAGCRADGRPGGTLLDPETTGLAVTDGERGHMEELGGVWKLGFDIHIIDWCHKSDFIQRNALALTTAIERVRAGRLPGGAAPLGGRDSFVLMGGSMGGLVARYALTRLEKDGPAHGVDLFISFDAPLEGAYLPIGIQQAAEFFGDFTAAFVDDETLTQLRGADTPAARQMLLMHHDGANRSEPHDDFKLLFTELDLLGYPRAPGLRTVAIANGGGSGKASVPAITPLLWEVGKLYDKTFDLKFPKDAKGTLTDPILWKGSLRVKLEPVIDLAVHPHTQANVFQEVFRVAVQIPNPTINGFRIPVTGFSVDSFLKVLDLPEIVPAESFLKPIIQDVNDALEVFLNPFKLYQRTRLRRVRSVSTLLPPALAKSTPGSSTVCRLLGKCRAGQR